MPVALTVQPVASVLRLQQREPVGRRLRRLALRSRGPLTTFWQTLFRDVRREIDTGPLTTALRGPLLLDGEQQVMAVWERYGLTEAWALLPVLLRGIMADTGRLAADDMQVVAGERVSLLLGLQEPAEALQRETGTLLRAVTTTTLLGLRALLHRGRVDGLTPPVHAAQTQEGFGLTVRQVRSLDAARARWQDEGRSAAQITQAAQEATTRGIAQRVRAIAETQAFRAVNLGHRVAMTQAAQAGPFGVRSVRRFWETQAGACAICRAIAWENIAGVPLDQPFVTPDGPTFDPPAHVFCRCQASYSVIG